MSSHSLLTCKISAEKSADRCIGTPLNLIFFLSRIAFRIFLFLIFDHLIMMCLGELPFGLNLIRDLWASYTWMLSSFPRFGKVSATVYLNMLSGPCFLFSPSENLKQMFILFMVTHNSWRLSFFHSFCFSDYIISNGLSSTHNNVFCWIMSAVEASFNFF